MSEVKKLPNSWDTVGFDDAVSTISDNGIRIKQKDYLSTGSIPVIDQGDSLIGGYTNLEDAKITHPLPLIVFGDHTRRFKYVTFPFAVGADGVKLFNPTTLWDKRFFFFQLETINLENRGYSRHYQYLRKAILVLPPKNEQTRIVEKLEELLTDLDTGVNELKTAQKKLTQYRQSLLKAAVEGALTAEWRTQNTPSESGSQLLERILKERRARWEQKQLDKFNEQGKTPPKDWQKKYVEPVQPDTSGLMELPKGWVWASVDQLSHFVRNGISKTPNKDGVGYPILKINAVRSMSVSLSEIKHIDLAESEAANYCLEVGDLLATRYNGSVDLLGVFGLVTEVKEAILHPDKLIRMKPVLDSLGSWIEIAANIGSSRKYIVSRVKTTAGQTGISGEDLKKMPIPLPSIIEQHNATSILENILPTISEQSIVIATGLKQSAAQRKNILKAAFSGQLVPQNPNDEPASVLLERIKAERAKQEKLPKKANTQKTKEANT